MKKLVTLILFTAFYSLSTIQGQPVGQWTWMNGSSAANALPVFGTQGVFAPGNSPPAAYEACEWTDQQGNFWLYGGDDNSLIPWGDLWEFKATINLWAWIQGPGVQNSLPVFGTQGVPAPGNTPGAKSWGVATWTDNNGNLWMFGGRDNNNGTYSDLWEYNIATNEWTWMKGPGVVGISGTYGTMGIGNPANNPGARREVNATWTDNNNDLWMFGGFEESTGFCFSDLWKYDIAANEWTWMNGPNTSGNAGNWGTMGVASTTNIPCGRRTYCHWKDPNGDLWFFGGNDETYSYNDLWKYNIASNEWTWMSGTSNPGDLGSSGPLCTPSTGYYPSARYENRAFWIRTCGTITEFMLYGGGDPIGFPNAYGDLWNYDVTSGKWTMMNGTTALNPVSSYGTITVSSPANYPGGRIGALSWKDLNGNLWLYGGMESWGNSACGNDMWRFVPDSTCPNFTVPVNASFTALPDSGCPPLVVNFTNTSTTGATYHWSFGDGGTDSVFNPTHTFLNFGTDTVTLVVTEVGPCGTSIDSVKHTIVVDDNLQVNLGPDTTLCDGQTLILDAHDPGSTYQWSTGETTEMINVTTPGTYWVVVHQGSCVATDTINVNFVPVPVVNLGNDTSLCAGQPITLDAGNPGANYLWSNGATTETITPTITGRYTVICSAGSCKAYDTINITFIPYPVVNLGPDESICDSIAVTLDAGNPGSQYLWSNGDTTRYLTTNIPGTYWVTVNNGPCIASDTITLLNNVRPVVDLGPPVKLCYGQSLILDAGNPGMHFLWSTGMNTETIDVTQSGTYWVEVTSGSCHTWDTVKIYIAPELIISLGPDTFICPGDQVIMSPGDGFSSYKWIPGGETTSFIIVNQPGTYGVTVTDADGCTAEASKWLRDFCPSDMYIPSGFTPNGNGNNDFFMAYCENVQEFHMIIFDRWGELIYESYDISTGWDGTFEGKKVPQGVYVYKVEYRLYDYTELQSHTKIGRVTLIR